MCFVAVIASFCSLLYGQSTFPGVSDRTADFHTFVDDFERDYAFLDQPEKPWLTWETRYRAAVEDASTLRAFDTVLAAALSELHDFHAEVRSPVPDRWLPVPTFADLWAQFEGPKAVVTAVRRGSDAERAGIRVGEVISTVDGIPLPQAINDRLTPAVNQTDIKAREWALLSILTGRADESRRFGVVDRTGQARTVDLPVERSFDRGSGALTMRVLAGKIGYIRLNNSLGEQSTVAAFDRAILELRSTRALVLDLRDTPSGGDSSVALGILGRFTTTLAPYQRHRIPHYRQADVERNWVEMAAPRGPFPYMAPMVVLVDHWTGSMGEGIAIGLDAMQRAMVVGTPMAHLAGAVSDDKLPHTRADVAYATEQIFHVNGTPRHEWVPPVLVRDPGRTADEDPILERGLRLLAEPR